MAANSTRERIILKVIEELSSLVTSGAIRTISRRLPEGIEDLDQYATTQLPLVVVMGKLPRLIEVHGGNRSNRSADCRLAKWSLPVQIFGYFMDNSDPDSTLSSFADDLFRVLNSDPSKGSLALDTKVSPDTEVGIWDPYVAFKFLAEIQYVRTLGGI